MLAQSRDLAQTGHHEKQGRAKVSHLLSAGWYQLTARLAHLRAPLSGEEAVLKAYKLKLNRSLPKWPPSWSAFFRMQNSLTD